MPLKRTGPLPGEDVTDEFGGRTQRGWEMRDLSRDLRKNQTDAEKILWDALRRKQLQGLKFYRQVAIDRYVVDFYCPARVVIVEVDGDIHTDPDQEEHDLVREEVLRGRGFRILRVQNEDVLNRLGHVLQRITAFAFGGAVEKAL